MIHMARCWVSPVTRRPQPDQSAGAFRQLLEFRRGLRRRAIFTGQNCRAAPYLVDPRLRDGSSFSRSSRAFSRDPPQLWSLARVSACMRT
jgi:hypothetical protein